MITDIDPLEDSPELSDSHKIDSKRREIKNIIKSYVGMFDVFSETIQNALDSIERMQKNSSDRGEITIEIDLDRNTFTITDNGTGFSELELKKFLAPNVSFNKGPNLGTRGNKGVGATYLAFGFDRFIIRTKSENFFAECEFNDGRNWVEDTESQFERPKLRTCNSKNNNFAALARGASVTIGFGTTYSRPKTLNYFQATSASQWSALLRCKTPLGILSNTQKNILCTLLVHKNDSIDECVVDLSYPYPHEIINNCLDLDEYQRWQFKIITEGKSPTNIPSQFKKRTGIYKQYSKDDLKKLSPNYSVSEINLINQHDIWAYAFFAHSTNVWDVINDDKFGLRKKYRIMKGGLQLANNTMIQGDPIIIPLSSNMGYQNQCHVVVHLTNAEPDLGRKGFQPEIKDLCESIASSIVNNLKKFRELLRENSNYSGLDEKEKTLYEWIQQQEEYQKNHPLILSNQHFFKPKNEISILSIPQSEQDVVALFNQLIAGGVIRSIELMSSSQRMQYDGVYRYRVDKDNGVYVYDETKNPLGVFLEHIKDFQTQPKILEYKFNLDNLIQEFHNEEKRAKDINLAVCWEIGDKWKEDFDCISLLDTDNISHRRFHGITHSLKNQVSEMDLIVLSDLIEYLSNPIKSQARQKELYGIEY